MKKKVTVLFLLLSLTVAGRVSSAAESQGETDQKSTSSTRAPTVTSNASIGFSTKNVGILSPAETTDSEKKLSSLPKTGERISIGATIIGLLFLMMYFLKKRSLSFKIKNKK